MLLRVTFSGEEGREKAEEDEEALDSLGGGGGGGGDDDNAFSFFSNVPSCNDDDDDDACACVHALNASFELCSVKTLSGVEHNEGEEEDCTCWCL